MLKKSFFVIIIHYIMFDFLKERLSAIGDPYALLGVKPDASNSVIDDSFRRLALIHHPDKTKNPVFHQLFEKQKAARDFLKDPQLRQQYNHYLATQAENQRRLQNMSEQRRKLAQQLSAREKQAQLNFRLQRQQKQRRRKFQENKQRQEDQKQKLKQEIFKQMKPSQYYKSISSIRINWSNTSLRFNKKLLKLAFQNYGLIEQVQVKESEGIIQFKTIEGADKAISEFQHPFLVVSYMVPFQKRAKLLKILNTNKKQKMDLTLNSDNLKRLTEIMNRNSNVYSSKQPITINLEQVLRQQNLY